MEWGVGGGGNGRGASGGMNGNGWGGFGVYGLVSCLVCVFMREEDVGRCCCIEGGGGETLLYRRFTCDACSFGAGLGKVLPGGGGAAAEKLEKGFSHDGERGALVKKLCLYNLVD